MSNLGISCYFPFPRVKLIDQVFFDRTDSVMIRIEPDLRFDPLCHRCRNKALGIHSHDHHRVVRDLNLGATTMWLNVGYRKVVCAVCDAVRVEDLSFCDTGKLEGVNNKIKLIKRRAFGFHDPDYFVLKVKQAFPGRPAIDG